MKLGGLDPDELMVELEGKFLNPWTKLPFYDFNGRNPIILTRINNGTEGEGGSDVTATPRKRGIQSINLTAGCSTRSSSSKKQAIVHINASSPLRPKGTHKTRPEIANTITFTE